jgi:transposase
VTELLEYVPGSFHVVRHMRPKFSCQSCESIAQAPEPSLPIRRGRAGAGLLAHVLVSKYCDHLPLHRQAEIYARSDVDLLRSTLADMVGQTARLLWPLVDALARHVMAAERVHADDTTVPVLEPASARRAPGGSGSMCATTGRSPGRRRRPHSIASRPTARASTHVST